MNIKINLEIEAEILDQEEVEAIKSEGNERIGRFASKIFKEKLKKEFKEFLPFPVYNESKIKCEVKYED